MADTKKVKVMHIITMLELGGAQRNTLYTVEHLVRRSFEAVLVTGAGGILDDEAKALKGVKSYFIKGLVRQVNPVLDFWALISLFLIIKKEKPDIVHTHSSKAGILGRIAAHLAGTPVIIHTFHGFGFNDFQKPAVKRAFILSEQITARISDCLIAVSKDNIETALKSNIGKREQYVLIHSGIKISRYSNVKLPPGYIKSLGIEPNNKVVTTIGPFKPQKNLLDVVEMAKIVSEQVPETVFLLIGDGEQRPLIESKIKKLGLTEKIKMPGWRKDIPEILSITDVFVLTSLWEGLPRAALESFASGKPVAAYETDGVKDIITEGGTGFIVKQFDADGLAQKVALLLKDIPLSQKMGETCKKFLNETFDIDIMVKQQEELYLKLLLKRTLIK